MTIQRYLDDCEIQFQGTGNRAVEVSGHLEESALRRAFQVLCGRHAALRGRIRRNHKGYLLEVPPVQNSEFVVMDGDEATLRREVYQPLDISRTTSRLIFIRGGSRGFVAFPVSHIIADGAAYYAFWNELWQIYTDIVNGGDIALHLDMSLPASPVELCSKRGGWFDPRISESSTYEKDSTSYSCVSHNVRFSETDTSQLMEAAHDNKTTVGALVCGSVALALNEGSAANSNAIKVRTTVNLRKYVVPPVGATQVTNFCGAHIAKVAVSANSNSISIGNEIKEQVRIAIDRGAVPLKGRVDMESRSEVDLWFNNTGYLPRFKQPNNLTIEDTFRVMPLGGISQPKGRPTLCLCNTFHGRLKITCVYPGDLFSKREARQVTNSIVQQLHAIQAAGSGKVGGEVELYTDFRC